MRHRLILGDCLEILRIGNLPATCIFADPPDNIGLDYGDYRDKREDGEYIHWIRQCLELFVKRAGIVWFSFNVKWLPWVGEWLSVRLHDYPWLEAKLCIQAFTFGQHNHYDLSNNYRPLLRLKRDDAPLYPDHVRIQSWRQKHGDKRADPRGKVPGDVFHFPRVTGNSKQRRRWCPTQLNEGLVERCIKLSTLEGQQVLDPFAGSGTTLRVCKRIKRPCTSIEISQGFCEALAKEHKLEIERLP